VALILNQLGQCIYAFGCRLILEREAAQERFGNHCFAIPANQVIENLFTNLWGLRPARAEWLAIATALRLSASFIRR
jgi:hypothetical protein